MNKAEASPPAGSPTPEPADATDTEVRSGSTVGGLDAPTGRPQADSPVRATGGDLHQPPGGEPLRPPGGEPLRPPARTREAISRVSRTWVALAVGLVLTVAVLVFILQNLHAATVHFFTATWDIPLGVDLLLATVLGGGIVFAAGSIRILQLRRSARPPGRGRRGRRS